MSGFYWSIFKESNSLFKTWCLWSLVCCHSHYLSGSQKAIKSFLALPKQAAESQNHGMVGVGRDLCGSSSPIPLPKQSHPEQAAQDLVQAGFEYLRRRRLHNLSGQPVPVLHHPQSEEVLPHVQLELPVLQFVPIAPCPEKAQCLLTHRGIGFQGLESTCCPLLTVDHRVSIQLSWILISGVVSTREMWQSHTSSRREENQTLPSPKCWISRVSGTNAALLA